MHRKILVPLDGSNYSLKALDVAADLAEKYGSTLVLLHVAPSGEVPKALQKWAKTEQYLDPPEAIYEQAIADGILGSAEARLGRNKTASVKRTTEHGDAATRILQVADRENADLIVLGTRGLTDFQGLVLGSVAHKVTHTAPCTVITVH